jgi:hypothetical protein
MISYDDSEVVLFLQVRLLFEWLLLTSASLAPRELVGC